jgi:hypothetical protein
MDVDENNEDKDDDYNPPIEPIGPIQYSFQFSEQELTVLRGGIRDISLPTTHKSWAKRPWQTKSRPFSCSLHCYLSAFISSNFS